ncbi:MAG: hypothetical protein LBF27_25870 [Sphingobacterium sp.]|jgi:hypothetical protein|nr:hypothetical protein [Sphingobacterium sp.]
MIELPCLFVPESQTTLFDLGLDYKADTRPVTFLVINAFSAYIDPDGNHFTEIVTGGVEYICAYDYEKVKQLLSCKNL